MTAHERFIVLDDSVTYTFHELCRACKVKRQLVQEMINEGILIPQGTSPVDWKFTATSIKKIQVTIRLQIDLGVNLPGAALALELMEELERLRSQRVYRP